MSNINRITLRTFILIVITFSLIPACSVFFTNNEQASVVAQAPTTERPNVIFVMADDLRDNMFSAAGHPQLKTPNIDWLANNGVRFSNTYVAAPVCAQSRVSIFTGMSERKHRIGFGSPYKLTEDQWSHSYPYLIRNNGYNTAFIGKIGIEAYTFKNNIAAKFDHWYGHNGWTKFFPKKYPGKFQTKPYMDANKDIITEIMSDGIQDYLTAYAQDESSGTKPFMLSVSLNTPHGSQARSMGSPKFDKAPSAQYPELKGHPIYDDLFRHGSVSAHQDVGQDPYQYLPKNILDHSKGRANLVYSHHYNKKKNKESRIRYLQMIQGIDKLMGELITSLKKNGQFANTVIIFSSDHGLNMGENGFGGKSLLSDLSVKVPLLIFDPRLAKDKQGKTNEKLVSSLDITSTILAYTQTKESEHMQGMSLLPLMNKINTPWRNDIYLESLMSLRDNPIIEGVREGEWKYVRYFRGDNYINKNKKKRPGKAQASYQMIYHEKDLDFSGKKPLYEVLVNLKDDPEEKTNLITKMQDSKLLKKLRDKTARYSEQQMTERLSFMSVVDTTTSRSKKKKN